MAAVLDVGSRRLIGFSMSPHTAAPLVVDALDTAAASRGGRTAGVIFHSERGPQYLSGDFASALARGQMRQSAGRIANCWGNRVAESLFASLKRELVTQTRFASRDQARREAFAWIEIFYNRTRHHSSLGNISPAEFERRHQQQPHAARLPQTRTKKQDTHQVDQKTGSGHINQARRRPKETALRYLIEGLKWGITELRMWSLVDVGTVYSDRSIT